MKLEEKIVSDLVFDLKERLSRKVIIELKKDNSIPSEDENKCLTNLWEEYCISIQDENSNYSPSDYKKHIMNLFQDEFNAFSYYEKVAIWIRTPSGIDWFYDRENKGIEFSDVPFHFSDCEDSLYNKIQKIAKVYENDNIYKYLNMECFVLKEDNIEDEKGKVYE